MSKAFTLLAGFNVRLVGIIQNIGLLDEVYSKYTRETILSNCAHQIFFASTNFETQKYISASCGEHTVKSKSISKGRGFARESARISISEKIAPLIRPHEVNTFGADKEVILVEKHYPVKCKKIVYYKDKIFKKRLLPPHPTPILHIKQQIVPKFDIPKAESFDKYKNKKKGKQQKTQTQKKTSNPKKPPEEDLSPLI